MRPISVHVEDNDYRSFKDLAERTGRSVSELIREALAEYLARREDSISLLDLAPHPSGALLEPWKRKNLFAEMLDS